MSHAIFCNIYDADPSVSVLNHHSQVFASNPFSKYTKKIIYYASGKSEQLLRILYSKSKSQWITVVDGIINVFTLYYGNVRNMYVKFFIRNRDVAEMCRLYVNHICTIPKIKVDVHT